MNFLRLSFLLVSLGFISQHIIAQHQVRDSDHFWRKRVVTRIPLGEKVNRPIVHHQASYYGVSAKDQETNGIVVSLLNGLKAGKYQAYDPEDWNKTMSYEDVFGQIKAFDQSLETNQDDWGDNDVVFEDQFADQYPQDFTYQADESDAWVVESIPELIVDEEEEVASVFEEEYKIDYTPYEQVLHVVEDYVFDRTRSDMIRNIDFFEIIWVDPMGNLPEKVLTRFRWADVEAQLDATQWKNRFNDSETRSMKEVFVMHLFRGFFISYGGEPINSLVEAELRRQELVEFEHNLWHY